MNTLNDNFYSYSDILNDSTMNTGNINANSITVTGLNPDQFVATDSSQTLISFGITGTANQINANKTINSLILSLPQNIDQNANVSFNSAILQGATITGLTGNTATFDTLNLTNLIQWDFLGTDANNKIVSRGITGTNNQINITSGINGVTLSLPQNIDNNANVIFNSATLQGATITALNTSSIESISNTLNIGSNEQTNILNLACSTGVQSVNIGLGSLSQTNINIGGPNDYVTIAGTLTYINTDNLKINDNTIFLNSGGTTATSFGSGVVFEVTGTTYAGYVRQDTINGDKFIMKTVNNPYILNTPILTANSEVVTTNETQLITGNKTLSGNLTLSNLTQDDFIGLDSSKKVVTRTINGTSNQVTVTPTTNAINLGLPQNIHSGANPTFNALNLTSSINQNISGSKGFIIGNIANDTPSGYAGICHQSLASSFTNSCLQANSGGDVIYNAGANNLLVFGQQGNHRLRVWSDMGIYGKLGQVEVVSTDDYTSSTNSALRVNGGLYVGKRIYSDSYGTFKGVTTTYLVTSGITFTSATGTTLTTSNIRLTGATANKYAFIDSNYNIVSVNDPSSNLLSTNNTWSGTNTFSNTVNLSTLTPSKILLTDVSKNIVSSTLNDTDICTTNTAQNITGVKTFTANPIISNAGQVSLRMSGSGDSGFLMYSNDNSGGLQIMNLATGQNMLSLRNTQTANKLMRYDASGYLAPSTYDESDFVNLTTNQTIAGDKTIASGNKLTFNGIGADSLRIEASVGVAYTLSKNTFHSFRANNSTSDSLTISATAVTSKNNTLDDGTGNMTVGKNLTVTNLYNLPCWASFTLPDGSSNQTITAGVGPVKLQWLTQDLAGYNGFTLTSNTDIAVPSIGLYQVQFNRETTNTATTGEIVFFLRSSESTSVNYGMTQITPSYGRFITCSALIPITSTPATISAYCQTQTNNVVMQNVASSATNRLTIFMLSSQGTII